jgi:hypothetical protein
MGSSGSSPSPRLRRSLDASACYRASPPSLRPSSSHPRMERARWRSHRRTGSSMPMAAPLTNASIALALTTQFNTKEPMSAKGVRFCPGTQGGAEWNGPAYDPAHDVLITGEVDWCTTARFDDDAAIMATPPGKPWTGSSKDGFGTQDPQSKWACWIRTPAQSQSTTHLRQSFMTAGLPEPGGGQRHVGCLKCASELARLAHHSHALSTNGGDSSAGVAKRSSDRGAYSPRCGNECTYADH